MLYTELTKKALRIAFDAHKDQTDKTGLPYIFHPFHLAEQMETEDEVIVALLHDVVEDSEITFEDLRTNGFPANVIDAIGLLTKDDNEKIEYTDYILRIKNNPLAAKVKLADLRHYVDGTWISEIDAEQKVLLEKYIGELIAAEPFDNNEIRMKIKSKLSRISFFVSTLLKNNLNKNKLLCDVRYNA